MEIERTTEATLTPTSDAPVSRTAVEAAVSSGNVADFRAARRAERAGKPLPAVQAPAAPQTGDQVDATPADSQAQAHAPAAPAQPDAHRETSKRQQAINDSIREAVERATAPLRAEIEQLRARPGAAAADPARQPEAAQPPEPEWKRYRSLPDAPKLEDFESIEDHSAAMAVFIAEKRDAARRAQADTDSLTSAQRARVDRFVGQLTEARTSDPDFVNKLSDVVKHQVKPFAALKPGEQAGPLNIIGEQVYDSPIAPKVLLHFSTHPEDLQRLAEMPEHLRALPVSARASAHVQWLVREFGKLEARLEAASAAAQPGQPAQMTPAKTVSSAPPPAPVLGSRPSEPVDPMKSAVERGDTAAYRQLRRMERAAARGR